MIDAPEQVQIYESILGDASGRVTTGLLSAVRYAKDNRLLPRGFDKAGCRATTTRCAATRGTIPTSRAAATASSTGRRCRADAAGPFRIEVELLYQPIGFRWAHNLDAVPIRCRAGALRPLLRSHVRCLRDHAGIDERQRPRGAPIAKTVATRKSWHPKRGGVVWMSDGKPHAVAARLTFRQHQAHNQCQG